MKMEVCSVTDIGTKRKINQDSSYVKYMNTEIGSVCFGIVCDGVGSFEHSETASSSAVSSFAAWFENCCEDIIYIADEDIFCDMLYEKWLALFDLVNHYILDFASINKIRLGSTLSCILIRNERFYIMHIGDTRIYSLDSSITQLTSDHTITANEIEKGLITPEMARTDKRRHVLTKCVGVKEYIQPDFYSGDITEDTKFIICSDGFRDRISDDFIYGAFNGGRTVRRSKLIRSAKKIIRTDRRAGENDNITAVIIQISEV